MPESANVFRFRLSPICIPGLHPGTCHLLEGFLVVGTSISFVSLSLSRFVIRRLMASYGILYRYFGVAALHEDEGPGRLHSLEVTRQFPTPPCYVAMPAPFRLPPPPPPPSLYPLVVLILSLLSELVGSSASRQL